MPHNHGIRVMIENDDHGMSQVYAAGGVRLRERNRRRTEPMTWDEFMQGLDILNRRLELAMSPFSEMSRRIDEVMKEIAQPFTELSRQIEQSATGRVLTVLLNRRAGLSASAYRKG